MADVGIIESGVSVPNIGGQADFVADWHNPRVALEGGWMSGKTWAGARKLLTAHIANAFRGNEPTYVKSVVVGQTYRNIYDTNLPALEEAMDEAGLRHVVRLKNSEIVLPDLGTRRRPSLILLRSAERADLITGWQVGYAWGDEAARWPEDRNDPLKDPLLQLTGRVRDPAAKVLQIIYTYTNEGDATRVFEVFHAGRRGYALYRAKTNENPSARAFDSEQRENLPANLASQYLDGGAVNLRGATVYGAFDRTRHTFEGLRLVTGRVLHVCLDFNIAPGMHGEIGQVFAATDRVAMEASGLAGHTAPWGDGELFTVVHEIHEPRMDTVGLVRELHNMVGRLAKDGLRFPEIHVFGDATGRSQNAATGESCYQVLMEGLGLLKMPFQVRVPPSNPLVVDRVMAFNVAMADVQGRVRWCCHPRCKRLIEDLRTLRRNEYGAINKSDTLLSHASDAEGYRIAFLRPVRVRRQTPAARIGIVAIA